MSVRLILKRANYFHLRQPTLTPIHRLRCTTSTEQEQQDDYKRPSREELLDMTEFRPIQIRPPQQDVRTRRPLPPWKKEVTKPRADRMSTTQDWKSVWPAARMFHPAVVPLPVHMGFVERRDRYAPPGKFANLELMKIPNFLHLTPPAVKGHCQAIKKFCTPWPKELKTDEDVEKYFPVEVKYMDYVQAGVTIRDHRARIVEISFKLSRLPLDEHAKDKMKRLLNSSVTDKRFTTGPKVEKYDLKRAKVYLESQMYEYPRYDQETDMVTITSNKCPLKKQNYDYIQYLLTALFFESWKVEDWESEKTIDDWEKFYWDKSPSKERIEKYQATIGQDMEGVDEYKMALTNIYENGEKQQIRFMDDYKSAVIKMMFGKNSSIDGTKMS